MYYVRILNILFVPHMDHPSAPKIWTWHCVRAIKTTCTPGLSAVRLLLLLGELDRSETTTLMPAVGLRLPPRDDDSLLSEPSDVLDRVSEDFLNLPRRKKLLILLLLASPPSSSS